jgi:hypothetical protein
MRPEARRWSFDKTVNLPTLMTLVVMLSTSIASGFAIYMNFDHRITGLEGRVTQAEKRLDEQKSDNKEQLKAINEKLDRLLYDRAGVRREVGDWAK